MLPVSVEQALEILSKQERTLGNVAAGMLVRQYRLNGAWNEAQTYQVRRIINELAAAKRRADALFAERDVVGKATRALTEAEDKLERARQMRARMKLKKSPR